MSSAAFSDWQGRLSTLVQATTDGDDRSILACFRLFAGREAVASLQGNLTPNLSEDIVRALGPNQCLAVELQVQGKRVLAPRAPSSAKILIWSISSTIRVLANTATLPAPQQRRMMVFLESAHFGDLGRFDIHIGGAASSAGFEKVPSVSLRRGDMMEILLYRPDCTSFHFPFLVQPNCVGIVPNWSSGIGTSIWFIQDFVSLKPPSGSTIFYAAVLPCVPVRSEEITS